MSVPPSDSDWQPILHTEDSLPDDALYQAPETAGFYLPGSSAQLPGQHGCQHGVDPTLNQPFTYPDMWSDGVSPTSPTQPISFQNISAYTLHQDTVPQWQNAVTPYHTPLATQQAPFFHQDAACDAIHLSLSQQQMLDMTSQPTQLRITAAPSPPDSQGLTPFECRLRGVVVTSPFDDLDNSSLTSDPRYPVAFSSIVASDSQLGPLKRKRSFSETDASSLASNPNSSSLPQSSAFTRPKLGLVTRYGGLGQYVEKCAQEQTQHRNGKRPRLVYATPSPNQAQAPTFAPAEWLEGMSNNLNYQLAQSSSGPTINEWRQAGYFPGHRSDSIVSNAHLLQLPSTPTAPSPSATSIASSTRNSTKRSRDEMFIGAYRCAVCAKGFPSGNDLTHHERYHTTGPKPHICMVCHKDFLHSKDLRRHEDIHDPSPRKFYCAAEVCLNRKGYSRKDHLARHVKEKHPKRVLG